MRPPTLTVYLTREERLRVRRAALEVGLSASGLARLATLLVVRQVEEAIRRGTERERIIELLKQKAGIKRGGHENGEHDHSEPV